jgi:hypothetical protein
MGVLKNGPDVSTAAHNGAPTMTPASESGDETIGFSLQPGGNAGAASTIGNSATVETVTPGSPEALPAPAATTPSSDSAQPATNGSTGDSTTSQPAESSTPAAPANGKQSSSGKKKGGIHKVLPF